MRQDGGELTRDFQRIYDWEPQGCCGANVPFSPGLQSILEGSARLVHSFRPPLRTSTYRHQAKRAFLVD